METVNQIEYNGALYNIQDAEAQKSLIYSQNEIDTGKIWIDGKKIYRKVIDCGALPNASTKIVLTNIENANEITDLTIIATNPRGGYTITLPFTDVHDYKVTAWGYKDKIELVSNVDFSIYTKTFAILEYTKTTN